MNEYSAVDSALEQACQERLIPGAVLAFGRRGNPLYCRCFGHACLSPDPQPMSLATLFDLASLTKVLSTTTLAMQLHQAGELDLDRPLGDFAPGLYPEDKASLTPRHLLAHAAGLPSHIPFYREHPYATDDPVARRRELLGRIRRTPLSYSPGTETIYSDLGMILLGDLIETLCDHPLDRLFEKRVAIPLGLQDTFFIDQIDPLPKAQRSADAFAATEECTWRDLLVRGQVHDENACLLCGVAGHAGLFSTVSDLQTIARTLLATLTGASDFLQSSTVVRFTTRQDLVPGSDRALGWSAFTEGGSGGRRFSPRAFGHTGFTGTSIWIDPEEERYVVLLTNRVHPSRQDRGFLAFRPRLHDLVLESMAEEV